MHARFPWPRFSGNTPGCCDEAVGTWPYLAPEYKATGRSSTKTDVYAFGLTLLQVRARSPACWVAAKLKKHGLPGCSQTEEHGLPGKYIFGNVQSQLSASWAVHWSQMHVMSDVAW
eukprot:362754-Chlamydomonas_euryale.AAC.21